MVARFHGCEISWLKPILSFPEQFMEHALLISENAYGGAAKHMAYASRRPAPKGASDFEELVVSLKRYPDTRPEFCRSPQKRGKARLYGDESACMLFR